MFCCFSWEKSTKCSQKPSLVNEFSATPRGRLNWTGPIANSSELENCGPDSLQTHPPRKRLPSMIGKDQFKRTKWVRFKSWFLGRGWGQQLFTFQSPAVQWMARISSLNCRSCRNPYQTPDSLNCLPPFHWKPLFFTEKCFVTSPSQKSATAFCKSQKKGGGERPGRNHAAKLASRSSSCSSSSSSTIATGKIFPTELIPLENYLEIGNGLPNRKNIVSGNYLGR